MEQPTKPFAETDLDLARRHSPTEVEVPVIYVGGEGRSGSTVFSALLGELPGFFPVGEIHGIWQATMTNELCSCGAQFYSCDFWCSVGKQAFGGWESLDSERLITIDRSFTRHRHISRQLAPGPQRRKDLDRYTELLGQLYSAVRDASDGAVIVDSSKDATYALLLRRTPQVRLFVVHLIRDSRGVAYSWSKSAVARPEYRDHPSLAGTYMNTRSPLRAALEWDAKNLLLSAVRLAGTPGVAVRYEDLAKDPHVTVEKVLTASRSIAKERDSAALRRPVDDHHMIGGNRVRFREGPLELRVDDAWRLQMPAARRRVVTALTFPLLSGYRYR